MQLLFQFQLFGITFAQYHEHLSILECQSEINHRRNLTNVNKIKILM